MDVSNLSLVVLLALSISAIARDASAQPDTDIYIVPLTAGDGAAAVRAPQNLTRRPGYDNQPQFTPDGGALLFTSIRADGQADTYRYDLATGRIERVTRTPESEYSPTVTPGGEAFSVVRVESDSSQRLWRFELGGREVGVLVEDVEPVGYHAWAEAGTVALYVLGEPSLLKLADLGSGRTRVIARDIGRSLQKVPGRRSISFVQRHEGEEAWLCELAVGTGEVHRIVRTLADIEDHAWTPDGKLLMARDGRIYTHHPGPGGDWRELADYSEHGIREITRLAVSPSGDRLAFVAADAEEAAGR